jgi:hypothetical protein
MQTRRVTPGVCVGVLILTGSVLGGRAPLDLEDLPPLTTRPGVGPRAAAAKPDLVGAVSRAELVFVGAPTAVQPGPTAMSYPPIHSMRVVFDQVEVLKGAKPGNLTMNYRVVEGRGLMPVAGTKYLVVASSAPGVQGLTISLLAEATEGQVSQAKSAAALLVGWSMDEKGRVVSPWAALGARAWPKDVADPRLKSDVTCSTCSRPALRAGPGLVLSVEQVPPKNPQKFRNDYGDGQFKVTLTNPLDKPVDVPALLTDGKQVFWADSLVVIEGATPHLLPGAGALTRDVTPVHLDAGQSVSTVIDTLPLNGIRWPRGGSRVHFQFALGDLSASNFFYYFSDLHDRMRDAAIKALQTR